MLCCLPCRSLGRGVVWWCSALFGVLCGSALLWPVVGRRAVLSCAAGCLWCFLPGGGVCVLWCTFPPCRHAADTLIITLCYPAPVSVSVYHVLDETGLVVRQSVAIPGVTVHLLHLFVHVQQPGPHKLLVAALFGHVTTACSEKKAEASRVGHRWEEKVHGE